MRTMTADNIYDKEYFPKQVRFDTPSKSDPRLQSYSDPRIHQYSFPHQRYSDPRQQTYANSRQQSISQTRSNSDTDSPCPRPAAFQPLRLSTDKLAYNYGNEENLRKISTLGSTQPNVVNNHYTKNQNGLDLTNSPSLTQDLEDFEYNIGYKQQDQLGDNKKYSIETVRIQETSTSKQQISPKNNIHYPAPSNDLDLSIFDSNDGLGCTYMRSNVSEQQISTNVNFEQGQQTNTSKYTCEYNEIPHPFPPQKNISELGSPNANSTDAILPKNLINHTTQGTRPDTPDNTTDFFLKPGEDFKNPLTYPNRQRDNELVLKSKMEISNIPMVLQDHTNLLRSPNFHMTRNVPCNFSNMRSPCRNSAKENIHPRAYHGQHNICNCTPNIPKCQAYSRTQHACCAPRDIHDCDIPNTPKQNSRRNTRAPTTAASKSKAIEQRELQQKITSSGDGDKELCLRIPDKEEPTVADLCQIIKLQNEQLQLLQERVDKLVTLNEDKSKTITSDANFSPIKQTANQEVMTVETINDNIQKISIGVMTSFEMVRTSHSIMKVQTDSHNIQHIQCSQSQISVTKVEEPANFLDGITRCNKNTDLIEERQEHSKGIESAYDKTLNDLSLYPLQLEEVRTPDMSPEVSLHLDIPDYSDSDEGNSNVGWTYYNQVMNHVNEILGSSQDSSNTPLRSSSAAKRPFGAAKSPFSAVKPTFNTAEPPFCAAVPPFSATKPPFSAVKPAVATRLIGAANLSVSTSKRVTFGDCQEASPQEMLHHHRAISTDTSLQMNRLAMKYLQGRPEPQTTKPQSALATHLLNDMSIATRQYMQKHQLIQGASPEPARRIPNKILDITTLKKQPKLL